MKIGFIGLGAMGRHMAANLIKAGHELTVFDVNPDAVTALTEKGARPAAGPKALAAGQEVVFTSLPNAAIVEATVLGANGLFAGAGQGLLYIDLSSITPKCIRGIAEAAQPLGIEVLDAPVSGGTAGAAAGTLTIMAGGSAEAFGRARPVLACIGRQIDHVGAVGAGDTVKLVNNLLLGVNMAAVAEALSLGVRAGIDPAVLNEIISRSSGASYALTAKYEKFIAKGNFAPGFMIDLQYKDLELAISTAKELRQPLPMGNAAQQMFEMARAEGLGGEDISAVIKLWEAWGGAEVREG